MKNFDWKATTILAALMAAILLSSCGLQEFVQLYGPDGIDPDTDQVQGCECDSLHLVKDPAFIQGFTQWDFTPDSVVWTVGTLDWTTDDDTSGTDLLALLTHVWPDLDWTVYDTADAVVVFGDKTSDVEFIRLNVTSRPYIGGQPGTKYVMGWFSQTMYVGGALSFTDFKAELSARPSTKGMNLRGSDFTLEQSMELWELLLQWCECRVADQSAVPPYRADFRWGPYDPEIVTRFQERGWLTPTSIWDDPSPSPELAPRA